MSEPRKRNARVGFVIALVLVVLLGGVTRALADPCTAPVAMPSLPELRREARRHAGLDDVRTGRGRARASAVLPTVMLRAARALDWDDGGVYTGAPTEVGNNIVFEARLTWRFDRLLYDPAEPRLQDVQRAGARARTALDAEVTRLYFLWRRALVIAEAGDRLKQIDADEAWAHLDARTGGWLSRQRCGP